MSTLRYLPSVVDRVCGGTDRLSNEELARRLERLLPSLVLERLRETCATCRYFEPGTPKFVAYCSKLDQDYYDGLPVNGSGYCWQWEPGA